VLPTQRGYRGRDDALVLHLDRLGAGAPQRVEDGLDVLLVHDEVIRRCIAGKAAVGVALRVVERDGQTRPVHGLQPGVAGQLGGPPLHRCQRRVGGPAVRRVDGVGQPIPFGGQALHRGPFAAHQIDQPRCIATPDLATAGHPVGSPEQQPGQ